ncbi:MAG: ferrous iron transport protein B [Candidatus Schekmanbacteria bacterium]|nr:ferrous iron transport protein B [Candidatus Schekmanbacteria bacterium]
MSGPETANKQIIIAVAGNPNAGKSTLINAIAGTRLHVGNWPGVTVEKKEADFEYRGRLIKFVDLPGTYSLSPYTQEEIIARDFLVHERPDVIINVVDSTNLERNLYLTVQLMELNLPMVLALNIYDEMEQKGYKIEVHAMADMSGITIIPTVATKKIGLDKLLEAAIEAVDKAAQHHPKSLIYDEDIEDAITCIEKQVEKHHPALLEKYPQRWLAFKILESDSEVLTEVNLDNSEILQETQVRHLRKAHGDDIESVMADARYAQAAGLTQEVLKRPHIKKTELTEKIDRIMLNRFMGIPIFLAAMWLVFKLTFDISTPFVDWVDAMTAGPFNHWAQAGLNYIGASDWMVSLVCNGIIAGVGFVLVFVPVIFAMLFFITFLEGSGYMARAAFVMDRAMHSMGLHGKSFIPLLLGFGCNVPAIYATRTLENERDKTLTALLIPLMSCGARLPVYVLFVGAFFPGQSGSVLWSLYVLGIVLAVLMGIIFKHTLFKGEAPMFIMELPPYRMPSLKNLVIHTWEKGKHFLVKAGTYILAVSVLVWFLLNLPWGVKNKRDSFLGQAGQVIAPVLAPLGFGTWEAASALITGVIAKEIIVGTMGEIYAVKIKEEAGKIPALKEDLREIIVSFGSACQNAATNVFSTFGIASISAEEGEEQVSLRDVVQKAFTPLSAYAFMAFVLIYMPCMVVAVAMKHEFGTWKWWGVASAYGLILAWTVAFIIYQGGGFLGLGG